MMKLSFSLRNIFSRNRNPDIEKVIRKVDVQIGRAVTRLSKR